jgi:hypothetical protein
MARLYEGKLDEFGAFITPDEWQLFEVGAKRAYFEH